MPNSRPQPEDFSGTDRFVVQKRLGAGAFGVVYQAYDRARDSLVALKTLRQSGAEDLYFFKREFRALADVTHPNLVELYELLSAEDLWFFTMELVEGVSFLDWVRGAGGAEHSHAHPTLRVGEAETAAAAPAAAAAGPVSLARLRPALRQLVEGVRTLHEAGKLHRDIKPSNVLVTRKGRVVLLDFGMVQELASVTGGHHSDGVKVRGTPAYMSPEQGMGRAVSEATDWYSVGIILYEALCGRLPFEGRPLEILMAKQRSEPMAPRQFDPSIPEDLDSLCREMLRLMPGERPRAAEILARLGGTPIRERARAMGPPQVGRAQVFVGRERHVQALHDGLAAAAAGRPVAMLLHGPSGMGKSALARRFLDELRQDGGVAVFEGRCLERESVPYKALDSLVDELSQYLKRLPRATAEALLPEDVLALARLFPVLRQVEAVAGARRRVLEIPDSLELRRRAFAAFRELLVRLAASRPLVLAIDDLQWADADSAALLGEALRPPAPPPLLFVGCAREEGLSGPAQSFLAGAEDGIEVRRLAVGPLLLDESQNLALALSGSGSRMSSVRAEAIARESRGNPIFIDELVRYSLTAADFVPAVETGTVRDAGLDSETTLERMILGRVARLPARARLLLEVVAVAGQPIEQVVAKRAAGLERDALAELALLRSEHLVRAPGTRDRDQLEAYHDRIAQTVVGALPETALRLHHERLAVAWESTGRADPETLSMHFMAAEEPDRAAEYAAAAAERAADALAFNRAARLYRTALGLIGGEGEQRRKLEAELGAALANAGRGAEAAAAFLAAAAQERGARALELRRRAAEQLLRSGHIDAGLACVREVLGSVGLALAATPRAALASLLTRRLQIRVRGLRFQERDAGDIAARDLIRIDTCWSVAAGLALVDTIRGADFQARHLLLALEAGETYRLARALACEVGYSATGGSRNAARTRTLVESTARLAARAGNPHAEGLATLTEGLAAFLEGDWGRARELGERADGILRERCTGVAWELGTAQFYVLESLYFLGEMEEIARRLPGLLKEADERGDLYATTAIRSRFTWLPLLWRGDPDAARREADEATGRWSQEGFHLQHFWHVEARAEIAIYEGGPAAAEILASHWREIERSLLLRVQQTRILALHLRARAALTAAAGEKSATRLNAATADARSLRKEQAPWGAALAQLVQAGVAAAGGSRSAAAEFREAERLLQRQAMALYAAAARRRSGELAGDEAVIAEADALLRQRGSAEPARVARALAP